MINWINAFAKVPLKKAINVANATFIEPWNVFFCSNSAIKTNTKGTIITPKGGMIKLPTINPIVAARIPHLDPPALSTK